jgi:DNA-binding NtrC family response regulator
LQFFLGTIFAYTDRKSLAKKYRGSGARDEHIEQDNSSRYNSGGTSVNVLIVDDEIMQVENLGIGLRSRGYHVLQAPNGHEALSLIGNDTLEIDLVITDYAMPGMNGITLLQNIRWKHGSLPVILMTAYRQRDIVLDALRSQCNGFMDKPFTLDQLLHEIDRVQSNKLQKLNQESRKPDPGEHPWKIVFTS